MEKVFLFFLVSIASILLLASCSGGKNAYPERPAGFGTVFGTILDEDGNPVPARVYVKGSDDSTYFAVNGISYEAPFFGGRIGYSGKCFTTRGNTFVVHLPPGRAAVLIERGKEFVPVADTLAIAAGKEAKPTYTLRRWADMVAKGWYSGDTHVHRELGDMADLMLAEDLNVAVPQTVWNQKNAGGLDTWLARADSLGAVRIDATHIFSVLSHEIERFNSGAFLFHHTGKTRLPITGSTEWEPSDFSFFEKTHAAGGYCEIEKPWWPESHILLAVGPGDLLGIANNHFTYTSYLPEHPRKREELRADYPPGVRGYALYVFDLWYAYLNCGFRTAPTAGSASGVLPNPLGYNRVYVKLDSAFTYDAWFKALVAGRNFVTNGPLLIATANGKGPGETVEIDSLAEKSVEVVFEVSSLVPIERVEVLRNGSVMYVQNDPKLAGNSLTLTAHIPVPETCWIAVRAFEKRDDTFRFAHTAPIWVSVLGKPFAPKRYAAEYFLKKTREVIAAAPDMKFPTEDSRAAAMDVYQKAEAIYSGLAKGGK
jgi:hypothetical protein